MQSAVINNMRARLRRLGCFDISIKMVSVHCCHISFVFNGQQYSRLLNCDQWDYYPTITYNFQVFYGF